MKAPIEFVEIQVCGRPYIVQVSTELDTPTRAAVLKAHARDIKQHINCNRH